MKKQITLEVIIAVLSLLFIYASFSKLANFSAFERSIHNQPFAGWFTAIIIWTLPTVELLICMALFFNITRLYGLYAFVTLMGAFTLYIGAILLHFFPKVPCSCGGVIQALGWENHLVFNLTFILLALWAMAIHVSIRRDINNQKI